jgi:hypothetical protein
MLQETLAGFQVCCCASQRLHQACRGVYSCVQAAAAARVPDYYRHWIGHSAESGDGYAVLCHAIAYADDVKICVNKRDYRYLPPRPIRPSFIFIIFMQQVNSFFLFRHRTPLQESAKQGHLEICRLLIQCNADIEAKGWE